MNKNLPDFFHLHSEIVKALRLHQPIVALESTVITHGLPVPENLQLARSLEDTVRAAGAIPATIAVLSGKIHIGLSEQEMNTIAHLKEAKKVSSKDLSIATVKKLSGGTTVATTIFASHTVGIKVFATGGIGGVHRGTPFDVSADLGQLQKTPVIVVCSGAKSILDLQATREKLETYGIPVLGYKTEEFPAFYSISSGLKVDLRVEKPREIAAVARNHWRLGMQSAILVVNPPPETSAIPFDSINEHIEKAIVDAGEQKIEGAALTPFLLKHVSQLTAGKSLTVNLDLLKRNAQLAALIAVELMDRGITHHI